MVCKHVLYRGHVQGVGFRMTTHRLAARFDVKGHVKNLSDGAVEVMVQGEQIEVDRFLGALATLMASYIQDQDVLEKPLQPLTSFEIKT